MKLMESPPAVSRGAISEICFDPSAPSRRSACAVSASSATVNGPFAKKKLELAIKRVKVQEDRVTEAYVNQVMDLDRYKMEMNKLQVQISDMEMSRRELDRRQQQQ